MAEIRLVRFGSPEHAATLALRQVVMRDPGDPVFTSEEIRGERDDAHLACLRDDEVVACLVLTPLGSRLLQMRQVAVRRDLHRQGLGRRIVLAAEEHARERAVRALVFYARDEAVPFYLSLGYVHHAEWFAEVGVPEQMMAKRLL